MCHPSLRTGVTHLPGQNKCEGWGTESTPRVQDAARGRRGGLTPENGARAYVCETDGAGPPNRVARNRFVAACLPDTQLLAVR